MPKINWQALLQGMNTVVAAHYRWFVLGATVVVLWLGWVLLLQDEYAHIRDSGILEYQQRVERRQTHQDNLAQLQRLAAQVEGLNTERLDQLDAVLPKGIDSVALIDQMQAFADAAQVSILSIDVTKESETKPAAGSATAKATKTTSTNSSSSSAALQLTKSQVRTAVITVNITTRQSTYAGLKDFLDTLESFVPVLNLRNLTYSPATTSFALQLETYYLDSSTQQ